MIQIICEKKYMYTKKAKPLLKRKIWKLKTLIQTFPMYKLKQ